MELIKKIFDKNTTRGRAIRTALQGLVALVTFIYGLIIIPGVADVLAANNIATIASFTTWVGIITYVQNKLEDLWELVK